MNLFGIILNLNVSANQYFSDGKLMLDWAMERTEGGNPLCMDWFLLMAKYYALSTNTVPMFECDVNGNMDTYDVIIGRFVHLSLIHILTTSTMSTKS